MNDWKKRDLTKPSEEHELYRQQMAVVKKNFEPKKNVEQCASTQRLLTETPDERRERLAKMEDPNYWNDLAERAKAKIYTEEEMWERAAKVYGMDTIFREEQRRRGSKNSEGESQQSSASQERKEKAIDAYIFTPAAPLDPLKDVKQIQVAEELTLHKIREKEAALSKMQQKWLELKRKTKLAKRPEDMTLEERNKYLSQDTLSFFKALGFKEKK